MICVCISGVQRRLPFVGLLLIIKWSRHTTLVLFFVVVGGFFTFPFVCVCVRLLLVLKAENGEGEREREMYETKNYGGKEY